MGLCLTFTGCGSDKKEILTTTETFLQAAMNCDMETLSKQCNETVLTDLGLNAISTEFTENIIYENIQVDKNALSEESQKAVLDFCTYYSNNIIQNYTLGDATVENETGTVNATVTTYSHDALSALSSDSFKTELSTLMTNYQEEHMEELISINLNEGNEAMINKVFDDLMPEIMAAMKKSYDSYSPEELNLILTLEKQNDTWLITKATLTQ
jgi:hypothetical protein